MDYFVSIAGNFNWISFHTSQAAARKGLYLLASHPSLRASGATRLATEPGALNFLHRILVRKNLGQSGHMPKVNTPEATGRESQSWVKYRGSCFLRLRSESECC
jgi:hypothetical protein